jgi:hypothetical protein
MKSKAKNKRKLISIIVVAFLLVATTLVVVGSQGEWFKGSTFGLKAQPPQLIFRNDFNGDLYNPSNRTLRRRYTYSISDTIGTDEFLAPVIEVRAGTNPVVPKYLEYITKYDCTEAPDIPGIIRYSSISDYFSYRFGNTASLGRVIKSNIEYNPDNTSYIFKSGRLSNIPPITDSAILGFVLKPAYCSGNVYIELVSAGVVDTVTGKVYRMQDILTPNYQYDRNNSYFSTLL